MANTRKDIVPPAVESAQDTAAPAVEPALDTAAPAAPAAEPAPDVPQQDVPEQDAEPAKPRPFLSEGTRHDLEQWGKATDPITGAVFVRDADTGEVTVVEQPGV
jgi:hypothetical protein